MKNIYFLSIALFFSFSFFSCEENPVDIQTNDNNEVKDVTYNGRYLEFSSSQVFDSILTLTSSMNDEEFYDWENKLGFKSARSIMNEYITLMDDSLNDINISELKKKYSNQLRFLDDEVVRYKFYISSYRNVLNTEGEVKIDGLFYKFGTDVQYVSLDGNENRVPKEGEENLKSVSQPDSLLFVFGKSEGLKSASYNDVTMIEHGVKEHEIKYGEHAGIRRLIWSLERSCIFGRAGINPNNATARWHIGYDLYLSMRQEKKERKSIFNSKKVWKSNKAFYWIKDQYISWTEYGVQIVGQTPGYTGDLSDYYIGWDNDQVQYNFFNRKRIIETSYEPAGEDFALDRLKCRFYSSGILEAQAITIDR